MARVVLNKREVYKLLASPDGGTARYLVRKAYQVQNKARVNCPVDSGNLRGSITYEIAQDGEGLSAHVGTNVPYAIYVHEGTDFMAGRPFLKDALNSVF